MWPRTGRRTAEQQGLGQKQVRFNQVTEQTTGQGNDWVKSGTLYSSILLEECLCTYLVTSTLVRRG